MLLNFKTTEESLVVPLLYKPTSTTP